MLLLLLGLSYALCPANYSSLQIPTGKSFPSDHLGNPENYIVQAVEMGTSFYLTADAYFDFSQPFGTLIKWDLNQNILLSRVLNAGFMKMSLALSSNEQVFLGCTRLFGLEYSQIIIFNTSDLSIIWSQQSN